ncbi:polysaccharide biosynthesis/export family protein [Terriglobus sp.]|uniref:polysaccharide biosynthesis/export family protein n=1 Tax=Terriglobus sp. TaxID=1889013 RepID=UPI003AFFC3EA
MVILTPAHNLQTATTHMKARTPDAMTDQSRYSYIRRTCTRCGAALLIAGALCICMRAQTTTDDPNGPIRTSEAMTGTTGEYLLRPGDVVSVNYRFTPEFDDTATVSPDGRVALKNIGLVAAAVGTVQELQQHIVKAASAQLVSPEITVTLKDFERPQITVGGEVNLPGHFELRKPTTALGAILLAGGPKQDGAMNHVFLFRRVNGELAETYVLHLNHLREGRHASDDILLKPDDMILVRHDKLSTVERYMKIVNLAVYFNPIGNNGIF